MAILKILDFNTSLKCEVFDAVTDAILYNFEKIKNDINQDWSASKPPVHLLVKEYLPLSNETHEDGVLMNEVIIIQQTGPCIQNNLTTVPPRYPFKHDFDQLLRTRIVQCKSFVLHDNLITY